MKYILLIPIMCLSLSMTQACDKVKGKYHDDNSIEEFVEKVVEKKLENVLGLGDGTLDDKIDLTPWSTEDPEYDNCIKECHDKHPPTE